MVLESEINKPPKEVQQWYKQNLANTIVNHPKIGEIIIYNKSFNETRHLIPDKYLCVLYHLKELLETSTTNGQIVPPDKPREDGAIGFYYLYNKIQLSGEILSIRMDIFVAKDHKKYYVLQFTKNESHNLDFCMSISGLSERSIMTSNNIINENEKNVKPNPDNPKVGDVFWLGDSMRVEVIEINNPKEIKEDMENIEFNVKLISNDGSDEIRYDSNFYIEDDILYYLDEEIARDVEDDIMYAVQKIVEFCNDTVLEIKDQYGDIVYRNGEYSDYELDELSGFEESFKKYNETLKKALGE